MPLLKQPLTVPLVVFPGDRAARWRMVAQHQLDEFASLRLESAVAQIRSGRFEPVVTLAIALLLALA